LRSAALELLARREHSARQLLEKLGRRSDDADLCRAIVTDLEQSGIVSDVRFGEAWVRSRIRTHPESRFHLTAGLRQRGLAEAVANSVVNRVMEEEQVDEVTMIQELARRAARGGRTSPAQLARRLSRLGFRRSDIERALGGDAIDYPDRHVEW
jgi:regulatory protein